MGALPLIHSRCTVPKVHGDYMDSRLKNTAEELSSYEPQISTLLDRILMSLVSSCAVGRQSRTSHFSAPLSAHLIEGLLLGST